MNLEIIDKIYFLINNGKKIEEKLGRCQAYRPKSLIKWKKNIKLNWKITFKILKKLDIYDGQKIRQLITQIVKGNSNLFKGQFYITSFGSVGKSGGIICYEFKHTRLIKEDFFTESWSISTLPPNSTILFVEDIIGTGTQSLDHINDKLNLLLNPSHNPILLTLCATPEGMKYIEENSSFRVITGLLLNEEDYQHYSSKNNYFTVEEKKILIEKNNILKKPHKPDYDKGLLVAFYYSVPNNTMPIIWKENYRYTTKDGKEKKWFALIPRQY